MAAAVDFKATLSKMSPRPKVAALVLSDSSFPRGPVGRDVVRTHLESCEVPSSDIAEVMALYDSYRKKGGI